MGTGVERGDPAGLAGASEHSQQVALMAAVAQYVESEGALRWLYAVPNGGSRGSDQRSAMIQGGMLKAEGAKAGVADLCLPVARHGYHAFYIEMKKPGGGAQSKEQKAFEVHCQQEGNLYAIFHYWHEAFRALMWYLGFEHSKAWPLPS